MVCKFGLGSELRDICLPYAELGLKVLASDTWCTSFYHTLSCNTRYINIYLLCVL